MFPAPHAYDKMLTQFSPDGRLYQVEYALEATRRGGLVVGIRTDKGVVLAAYEKKPRLQSANFSQKVYQVDDHIAAAASGFIPDARIQIHRARIMAQNLRRLYEELASVESVTKYVADTNRLFTQHAVVRPFAASIVFGGVDETGPVLCMTDPSGIYLTYDAVAVGSGCERSTDHLGQYYRSDLSLHEACRLAIDCIRIVDKDVRVEDIQVTFVESETRKTRRLSHREVETLIKNAHRRE